MSDPFLDTRGPDGAGEPLAFDTAMGVVPEAVDLAGELVCAEVKLWVDLTLHQDHSAFSMLLCLHPSPAGARACEPPF